jgi:hypothetical protein
MAGPAVAPAANRELEAGLLGEPDGVGDVAGVPRPGDDCGMAIDMTGAHDPQIVVIGIAWQDRPSGQRRPELADGWSEIRGAEHL